MAHKQQTASGRFSMITSSKLVPWFLRQKYNYRQLPYIYLTSMWHCFKWPWNLSDQSRGFLFSMLIEQLQFIWGFFVYKYLITWTHIYLVFLILFLFFSSLFCTEGHPFSILLNNVPYANVFYVHILKLSSSCGHAHMHMHAHILYTHKKIHVQCFSPPQAPPPPLSYECVTLQLLWDNVSIFFFRLWTILNKKTIKR